MGCTLTYYFSVIYSIFIFKIKLNYYVIIFYFIRMNMMIYDTEHTCQGVSNQ